MFNLASICVSTYTLHLVLLRHLFLKSLCCCLYLYLFILLLLSVFWFLLFEFYLFSCYSVYRSLYMAKLGHLILMLWSMTFLLMLLNAFAASTINTATWLIKDLPHRVYCRLASCFLPCTHLVVSRCSSDVILGYFYHCLSIIIFRTSPMSMGRQLGFSSSASRSLHFSVDIFLARAATV